MVKSRSRLWRWRWSSFDTCFAVVVAAWDSVWPYTRKPPSCKENDVFAFQFCWTAVTNRRFIKRGMMFYQKQPLRCSIDVERWVHVRQMCGCAKRNMVFLRVVRLGRPEAIRPELLRYCIDRPLASFSSSSNSSLREDGFQQQQQQQQQFPQPPLQHHQQQQQQPQQQNYGSISAAQFKEQMKQLKSAQVICCTWYHANGAAALPLPPLPVPLHDMHSPIYMDMNNFYEPIRTCSAGLVMAANTTTSQRLALPLIRHSVPPYSFVSMTGHRMASVFSHLTATVAGTMTSSWKNVPIPWLYVQWRSLITLCNIIERNIMLIYLHFVEV